MDANQATLAHIELLTAKIDRLRAARHDAASQYAHRINVAARAGDVSAHDLAESALALRDATGRMEGLEALWNQHSVQRLRSIVARMTAQETYPFQPNRPDGCWEGTRDAERKYHSDCARYFSHDRFEPHGKMPVRPTRPPAGQSVVYVLYDAENRPCYVGSTGGFAVRLGGHDDKPWESWLAFPCADREAAYRLEVELLREFKPYLNRKVGR